jgi:hypothetical protein
MGTLMAVSPCPVAIHTENTEAVWIVVLLEPGVTNSEPLAVCVSTTVDVVECQELDPGFTTATADGPAISFKRCHLFS